jgi:tetratricopeptide (TPR) repeat protein
MALGAPVALRTSNVSAPSPSLRTIAHDAHRLVKNGDLAGAWRAVEQGWSLVANAPRTGDGRAAVHRLSAVRAQLQLAAGQLTGVHVTVRAAYEVAGPHPDLEFLEACTWEAQASQERDVVARGRLLEAALDTQRAALAVRRGEGELVDGASTWAAWTRIGLLHLQRSEPDRASDAFDEALATRPDGAEALLGKVECALQRGDAERVFASVETYGSRGPDVWLLAASAAEEVGAIEPMANFLARAKERLPLGYVSRQRAARHAELVCAMAAYRGTPMAGPGLAGTIGALLARAPRRRGDLIVESPDPGVVRRMTRNLIDCGRIHLLVALLEPRAEALLPGIGAQVLSTFAERGIVVGDDHEPEPVFVIGDERAAVEFVAGLLGAHPRLLCRDAEAAGVLAALERCRGATETDAGPTRRDVYVAAGPGCASLAVGACAPGARFFNVIDRRGAPMAGSRAPSAERHFDVDVDDLLDAPVEGIERLLAFIGEPTADEVVRHLIEHYLSRRARSA